MGKNKIKRAFRKARQNKIKNKETMDVDEMEDALKDTISRDNTVHAVQLKHKVTGEIVTVILDDCYH